SSEAVLQPGIDEEAVCAEGIQRHAGVARRPRGVGRAQRAGTQFTPLAGTRPTKPLLMATRKGGSLAAAGTARATKTTTARTKTEAQRVQPCMVNLPLHFGCCSPCLMVTEQAIIGSQPAGKPDAGSTSLRVIHHLPRHPLVATSGNGQWHDTLHRDGSSTEKARLLA